MAKLNKTIKGKKYTFELYKEANGKWYANARVGDEEFFIHKWCHGYKTRKALVENIKSFTD